MFPPVGIVQVCVANGAAAVQHSVITYIDPAVGDTLHAFAHRALKEHDVSRLRLIRRNRLAKAVQTLRSQASCVVHAAMRVDIADEP